MPEGTEALTLAIILTGAGTTISAALIASVIQILKRLPGAGRWIDANREPGLAVLLSALLVGYAFVATTTVPDLLNGFAAFLSWVGIAGLAGKAYDVAPDSVKTALSGDKTPPD